MTQSRMLNDYAFPHDGGATGVATLGMTLRDYFAAQAMQTMLSEMVTIGKAADQTHQKLDAMIAKTAYMQADAMLAERAK